jgi:hypothetical protein
MCRLPKDMYVLEEIKPRSKAELQDAKFCPICGGKLHKDGDKLLCDRHGEMNVYLDRDPKEAH